MTIDQRLRDDLARAAGRIDDDPADVAEVIRAGRRRRILAPAAAVVAALAVFGMAAVALGPMGGRLAPAGLPTTDDATLNAAIGDPHTLVLGLCDGGYCLAVDDGHRELHALLADDPDVEAFYYVSKEQAAERVSHLYRTEPEHMLASFVVVVRRDADPMEVAERYRLAPGVMSWSSPEEAAAAEGETDPLYGHPLDVDLRIFLCDGRTCPAITDQERRQLERELQDDPDLLEVSFESREEAFILFSERFADEPELVESVDPDVLPESFRVTARADADGDRLVERYTDFDGVEAAVWQRDLRD